MPTRRATRPATDPRLGQVFTPAAVADLALALATAPGGPRGRVLDPACGDGVFLARAIAAGWPAEAVDGYEVDAPTAAAARGAAPGARVVAADFLDVPAPAPADGYDVVVGNPPYVRQELLGAGLKARIARRVREDWPDLEDDAPAGRADLAAAFVARALRFARPGGRVALVLSAAALESGWGEGLRRFLARRARVLAVVASPRERWFADAAVHGVIVALERLAAPAAASSAAGTRAAAGAARFARLRGGVAEAAGRVRGLDELDAVAEVRRVPAAEACRVAWGPLLRAPAAWFDVVAAAGDLLVPLGERAELWRGATTGANEFFYLTRAEARRRGLEARFLRPLLKTPRQVTSIAVRADALETLAFVCDLDARGLAAHPGAAAYVAAHAHLAGRPTLRARRPWWSLASRPARVFLTKAYDVRFAQPLADAPVLADQRIYALAPRRGAPEVLAAVLNGTLTALALESLGRASMGEGALEWSVADAARLPVVDPARVDAAAAGRALARLAARPVRPVFDEVAAADRRALDEALLRSGPPALRELLPCARAALATAVADRIARTRPGADPADAV